MTKRRARVTGTFVLVLAGIALLIWWAVGLGAYGSWVDENSAVGTTRPIDVILFAGGVLCLALACATPAISRRRARREAAS